MQAQARVCEENKLELEEKTTLIKIKIAVKCVSLKNHVGSVERRIKMIFSRMIHHSIKVLVLY